RRELTLRIYREGAEHAATNGILVADTKVEFGWDGDTLTLGDEVLTSDSSRFWPADEWQPGRPQHSFDKQFVRDWSATTDWDRTPPGPEIPDEIVRATRQRYVDVYERLTGRRWSATPGRGCRCSRRRAPRRSVPRVRDGRHRSAVRRPVLPCRVPRQPGTCPTTVPVRR